MAKQEKEMSFLDHLEELRWHLVRSFVVIFIIAIVIFTFQTVVFDTVLFAHLKPDFATYKFFCNVFTSIGIDSSFCDLHFNQKLQSLNPTQQLMTAVWASFNYWVYRCISLCFMGILAIYFSRFASFRKEKIERIYFCVFTPILSRYII